MNTITPLTGIPAVGSSTSKQGGQGKQPSTQQGQHFKATVLEVRNQNTFVLDIGGNRISAQSSVPLTAGQQLQLQVTSTTPQVELRIISDSTNLFLGKSITLVGKNIDLSSLFQSFSNSSSSPFTSLSTISKQTLESYFNFDQTGLTGKDSGNILKQLVDRIGLSFEALLARGQTSNAQTTLKSALLEISEVFKGAEELATNTNKLLSTIELYQLAQLQLDKDNLFIFPLPIPFLEKGYLIVDRNSSNEDAEYDEDESRFSLHLAMAELGNLRIDFLKNPDGMYIRFISDSQEKLDFIENYQGDLLDHLLEENVKGISFSHENIDPAADLLKQLLPDGESIVNTKV